MLCVYRWIPFFGVGPTWVALVAVMRTQAGRSHMKHLMADLEAEQEKSAGLAAALDGGLAGGRVGVHRKLQ